MTWDMFVSKWTLEIEMIVCFENMKRTKSQILYLSVALSDF